MILLIQKYFPKNELFGYISDIVISTFNVPVIVDKTIGEINVDEYDALAASFTKPENLNLVGYSMGGSIAFAGLLGIPLDSMQVRNIGIIGYAIFTIRYRQYLLSLDIDWTKIKTNSKILKIILRGITFVKLPFPALEYNSKGNLKGYYLYY